MSDPDQSWAGTALPGNESIADQARAYARAAHRAQAADKMGTLGEFLRRNTGQGSDSEGVATAAVDHARNVVYVVFDQQKWRGLDRARAERAAAEAVNEALRIARAKHEATRESFTRGFEIEDQRLPTLRELYERHGGEDVDLAGIVGQGRDPDGSATVVADHEERVKGVVFASDRYPALTRERAGAVVATAANAALRDVRAKKLAAQKARLAQAGLGELPDAGQIFERLFPEQAEQRRTGQGGGR